MVFAQRKRRSDSFKQEGGYLVSRHNYSTNVKSQIEIEYVGALDQLTMEIQYHHHPTGPPPLTIDGEQLNNMRGDDKLLLPTTTIRKIRMKFIVNSQGCGGTLPDLCVWGRERKNN